MNLFLWFFLFLSVPVLVHLFNFRKAKPFFFTNVRFIQKISTEARSEKKIKYFLILCSRMLAFFFFIHIFLSAFYSDSSLTNEAKNQAVYLDNSISLSITDNFISKLNEGVEIVSWLISQQTQGEMMLIRNDFLPFSVRKRSISEIEDVLGSIAFSYSPRSLDEILYRVKDEDISELFLYSDFQFLKEEDIALLKSDTSRNYSLLVNDLTTSGNVYIDTAFVEKSIENYLTSNVRCIINASGFSSENNIVVKLMTGDGNQLSSVVRTIDKKTEVIFDVPNEDTASAYIIKLSGDNVSYDNSFFLWREPSIRPTVLLISDKPNVYLSRLFGKEELFSFSQRRSTDIDYSLIKSSDVVILNEFFRLPEGIFNTNGSQEYPSYIVIPSDSIDTQDYSRQLNLSINRSEKRELFEVEIDINHPLFRGVFRRFYEETTLLKSTFLFQSKGNLENIMKLRNGSILLGKKGNLPIYFFATPLNDKLTRLPNHAIFLPLMYQIVNQSASKGSGSYYYPDDLVTIEVNDSSDPIRIVNDEMEIIPEYSLRDKTCTFRMPNHLEPGFYHLIQHQDTLRSIAINLSREESNMEAYTFQSLENEFSNVSHIEVINVKNSQMLQTVALTDKNDLWKYALLLGLVFILIETMLHRYLK